jgi:hypothetical protein
MFSINYPDMDYPKVEEFKLIDLRYEHRDYIYDGSINTRPNLEILCVIPCDQTILILVREKKEPFEKSKLEEIKEQK